MQHVHPDDSTGMRHDLEHNAAKHMLSTSWDANTETHTRMHAQPQAHLQSLRPSTGDVPDLAWVVVQMMPEAVCLMVMIMMLMLMQHLTLLAGFC